MRYDFNKIEANWQKYWAENQTFRAEDNSTKPKYYVLDMFPYPSGAGLHVGHPLGYIASDIYARYKRHKGFNVLHPQGYDSFGLPAEQYAIQTGQHPALTTEENIARYRQQLDQMGFSFDWSREVRTSNPDYYKWTQWIFIQLFESWYDKTQDKARDIQELAAIFSTEGNASVNAVCDVLPLTPSKGEGVFTAKEWNDFSETEQQEILLKYRLTYLSETEVNWCPALGTVLANDEIVNGVSERGGHPIERKKMKQWSMRISAYAERLLQGLENLDWSGSLKETQRNWIGKSEGAIAEFPILSFPKGEEKATPGYMTGGNHAHILLDRAKEMRNKPTEAERVLWECVRNKRLGYKFRQQHLIDDFIVDFVCLRKKLVIEVDGKIHEATIEEDQKRTEILNNKGFKVIRFKNEKVLGDIDSVLEEISAALDHMAVPPPGARGIDVFTTRPDTIFGVTFMTLAPEHELVSKITTPEQKEAVEAYVKATAKRSERERMADVKTISGVFTGAYAEHPFTKESIPIWIGDYVLAGYGTGAVMAVPCGDQRDYDFAKHFDLPIKNIFKNVDISEEAYPGKDEQTLIANSDFLNGLTWEKALKLAIEKLEEIGQGKGKINYRLRDAVFSRQRYWGEPFPIYYKNGMPQPLPEECLPLRLPEVEKYLPTEDGKPPLGNATKWHWNEETRTVVGNEIVGDPHVYPLELNTMPGWAGSSWYLFRYMEKAKRKEVFASKEALDYWQNVDLYIGGSEHGTGHLLYSRFWTKFLKDRNLVPVEEPFKKLINQGMILGESAFVYKVGISLDISKGDFTEEQAKTPIYDVNNINNIYISYNQIKTFLKTNDISLHKIDTKAFLEETGLENKIIESLSPHINSHSLKEFNKCGKVKVSFIQPIRVKVEYVDTSNHLDINSILSDNQFRKEFKNKIFILDNENIYDTNFISVENYKINDGKFLVSREVEKMSKSKYNVVNPDDICEEYGADTLRMYEMFLGPLEQAKPWNTAGITGVHNFLKKLWKLYHSSPNPSSSPQPSPEERGQDFLVSEEKASAESLKTLHKTIKKATEDIEDFSFNTSVSSFMICVNELSTQKCVSREILEPLAVLISPYAPHIAEELWRKLGHQESISTAEYPVFEEKHVTESTKTYPISFNGKMRFTMDLSLELSKAELEKTVMADERTQRQLDGRTPKKVIVVPGKIVNIVG